MDELQVEGYSPGQSWAGAAVFFLEAAVLFLEAAGQVAGVLLQQEPACQLAADPLLAVQDRPCHLAYQECQRCSSSFHEAQLGLAPSESLKIERLADALQVALALVSIAVLGAGLQ